MYSRPDFEAVIMYWLYVLLTPSGQLLEWIQYVKNISLDGILESEAIHMFYILYPVAYDHAHFPSDIRQLAETGGALTCKRKFTLSGQQ